MLMHFAAHGVIDHIALWYRLGEILAVVIDNLIGAEAAHIIMVAQTGRRIDGRAKMLCVLNRETADTPGAGMNKDRFTPGQPDRIQRNNGRRADQRQRGGVHMGQAGRLARNQRCIKRDRFGIGPLLGLRRDAEDLVAHPEVGDAFTGRPHHAGKIDARRVGKIQKQIVLTRAIADFPIHRIDARGMNIDKEFSRAGDRIDYIAQLEHLRTAIGI